MPRPNLVDLVLIGLVLIGLAAAIPAAAGEMSPEIAATVKAIGPVIDPEKTAPLFAPLQKKEPYDGVIVERDLRYGSDARNRLDVFHPATADKALRPILVFVHGGGFTGGDKSRPGSPFCDNVMLWAVANGMVGVNITYRLAPEHPYPAGAEDVAMAVQWTLENAARFGGDARRIFLMGHSAGAVHVATYIAHPEFQKVKGGGLAGAILVSGIYEFTADTDGPAQRAYFGADLSKWPARSSLKGLVGSKLPLLVVRAQFDPTMFIVQGDVLNTAMCSVLGGCPTYLVLQGHSHMSEVYSINTDETRLTSAIGSFVSRVR
jgi:triacylglycerol lipase